MIGIVPRELIFIFYPKIGVTYIDVNENKHCDTSKSKMPHPFGTLNDLKITGIGLYNTCESSNKRLSR